MLKKEKQKKLLRIRKDLYSIAKSLAQEVDSGNNKFNFSYQQVNKSIDAVEELCFDYDLLDQETLEEKI